MDNHSYPLMRLTLSRRLAIESSENGNVVVYDTDANTRLKIGRRLFEVMQCFATPKTVADVIPDEHLEMLRPSIEKMIDYGFLLDIDGRRAPLKEVARKTTTVSPTLFRTPLQRPGSPAADVGVVGVAYDSGSVVSPGTRHGPEDIRTRSCDQEYRVDFATGKPMGWFDVENMQSILEGVTISDWGNVRFTYGENPDAIFERIGAVCAEMIGAGTFPIFLGGDHSISYPVIEALQRDQPISVVWLDAHTDYGDWEPGMCNNHKNVVRRLFTLPNVKRLLNVGHRGYTSSDKVNHRPPKLEMVTAAQVRKFGPERVLEAVPRDLPCYISIDIDVLDPVYALGTSSPVPGGITPEELKDVLRAVGNSRHVLGFDMVEVNASKDSGILTSIQACQIVTVCLGAAMAGRTAKQADALNTSSAVSIAPGR
jgi:agmatinase